MLTRHGRARWVTWAVVLGVVLAGPLSPGTAAARDTRVPAVPGAAAAALLACVPGDTLTLGAGVHAGPLLVSRRVLLRGERGAVVAGAGKGTVLEVTAPLAAIEDLEIRGSGTHVITVDAGIRVRGAGSVVLRRLTLHDVLYGIHAERCPGIEIADCLLTGRVRPLDELGEGNGVHLWYCEEPRITGCRIERFMDAVYLSFTRDALLMRDTIEANGRYGFHTMYCQAGRLIENRFTHNAAGCAIMFSNHLRLERNDVLHNRGPRTYGMLLRDCSDGHFEGNRVVDNTVAIFLDNSNRNQLTGNLFQDNGWGILMFSSCADNVTAGNAFLNNDYPVALDMKYTRNRFDDGGRGNYWSENAPFDLDGDGVSDQPYSPVGTFAFLSKQYPDLAVLSRSPAVAALSVAERVLPALRPSEAVDRFPLVAANFSRERRAAAPVRWPERRAWPAVAGFGALAALSVAALTGARGRA